MVDVLKLALFEEEQRERLSRIIEQAKAAMIAYGVTPVRILPIHIVYGPPDEPPCVRLSSESTIRINWNWSYWSDPVSYRRRHGHFSTNRLDHPILNLVGTVLAPDHLHLEDFKDIPEPIARFVADDPRFFIGEVFAALVDGRQLREGVLAAYDRLGGFRPLQISQA